MTIGLRIAEVARQSGFTPATLRYYEEIGLLPPPLRSASGYRLYDDHALARLAFIARAKQLGCTLDEITDLSIAWDGGQCGPVQDRLRAVVAAKLAESQARAVELAKLTADLRRAAAALEHHRPDGPCDDRCGCTGTEPTASAVTLGPKPPRAVEPPIACTLDAAAMPGRVQEWNQILGFVTARSAVDGGVRLQLDPATPLGEVARLAGAEQGCCSFLSFAVTVDGRGTGLEIRAPADALSLVHGLFGAPS